MKIYRNRGKEIGKELVLGKSLDTGQRTGQNNGSLGQGPEKPK
jgi:hypothetical protein